MAVTVEELERRRRLALRAAQEVDPTEIEGLAPPPTKRPAPLKLETEQPNRNQFQRFSFEPGRTRRITTLEPPPQPPTVEPPEGGFANAFRESRQRGAELAGEFRQDLANRTAGRIETAASEFGEAFSNVLESVPEAAIRGVIAERQGQGIAGKIGKITGSEFPQQVANKLLGRALTEEELTRILPEIENNPVSKFLDRATDFGLGSNPEFLSRPDEPFEINKFLNSSVPAALGSMAGFVTAGVIAKGAGLGTAGGALTASGLGALTGGVETAKGVQAKGGNNAQIIDAFVAGNVPGLSEGIPIAKALRRLDASSGGTFTRLLKEGFKGSVEEGLQELFQGASTRAIENAILDLKQSLLDREVAEGSGAGAVSGFLISALTTAIGQRRGGGNRRGPAERAEGASSGEGQPSAGATQTQTVPPASTPRPERGDVSVETFFGREQPEPEAPPPAPEPQAAPQAVPEPTPQAAPEAAPAPAPTPETAQTEPLPAQPQPQPAAPPTPQAQAEPAPTTAELPPIARAVAPQGAQEGGVSQVQTQAGTTVPTQFVVVPLDQVIDSSNPAFPQALQPRERANRQASEQQIQQTIRNFNPAFLGVDASASAGAPTINNRVEVISGNLRTKVLERVFREHPELAQQYRSFVRDQLGVELAPGEALFQMVTQPMSSQEQRAFVDQANVSATAGFSPAEQARTDARGIDAAVLSSLQPTDVTSVANQDFVRAFIGTLTNRGENLAEMIQENGQLSAVGRTRVENALLARALGAGDAQVAALQRTLEDPGDNTRNITGAVLDAAPELAGLQIAAEQNQIAPEVAAQVAPALADAVELTSQLRAERRGVAEFLAQQDLGGPRPALTDEFIRAFFNPELTRPSSRATMAEIFRVFGSNLTRAADVNQGDLLGAQPQAVDPAAILQQARLQVQGPQAPPQAQPGLFGGTVSPTAATSIPAPLGGGRAVAAPQPQQPETPSGQQQVPRPAPNAAPMAQAERAQRPATRATPSADNTGSRAPEGIGTTAPTPEQQSRAEPTGTPPEGAPVGTVSGAPSTENANTPPPPPEPQTSPGLARPQDQNVLRNQQEQTYEKRPEELDPQNVQNQTVLGNSILDELDKEAVLNTELPNNHPNINTVAIAFNKDLIQDRSTSIIGKVVKTIRDLAYAAQIWRDPQFETLRYIWTDEKGKVIYQTGVSSRLPGSVAALPDGKDRSWLGERMEIMRNNGAVRLWMVHNHPSGSARPSGADRRMTRRIAQFAATFGMDIRHVVINSNEYGTIDQRGNTRVFEQSFQEIDQLLRSPEGQSHELLGKKIDSVRDMVAYAQGMQKPGMLTLMALDGRGKIRAIADMELDKFTKGDPKQLAGEIQDWRIHTGASLGVVLAGVPVDHAFLPRVPGITSAELRKRNKRADDIMREMTRKGIVFDIIDQESNSAVLTRQFHQPGRKRRKDPFEARAMQVREQIDRIWEFNEDTDGDSEAVRKQRQTVNNVRAGQPLDRLFRFMFTGFGVFENRLIATNENGEDPQWRFGGQAINRLVHFLNETHFPVDSETDPDQTVEGRSAYAPGRIRSRAYAYGNRILKRARNGLIDRANVPQGVLTLDERRFFERVQTVTEGVQDAKKLIEMGVDSLEEAVLLQRYLTGQASEDQIGDKEWAAVAEHVRAALDQLGMEAVTLGFISRESYERNKGTWLHRTYYKHEPFLSEGDQLNQWIGQTLRGAGRGIKGDEFKGRGLFLEKTQRELLRDINTQDREQYLGNPKQRADGKPDPSLLNQRFKIFDVLASTGEGTMAAPGIPAGNAHLKVKRRIYWPADQAIPEKFGNYEYRGNFVVRKIKGSKVVLWRDFDAKEREQMGEILDGRYNIIKSFQLLSRDLANGRFFKSIAENPEWTWDSTIGGPTPPEGTVAPLSDKFRHYADYEWVQVPNTSISKTAGVKKWGALAGRYVKMEIWKDISELQEMRTPRTWDRLLTTWKLNKTARNPVVHMNNVMSNTILMDLLDIRTRDLVEGFMMRMAPAVLDNPKLSALHPLFRKHENRELVREMRANGAFGHSLIDMEITGEVLDPLAKELRSVMQTLQKEGKGSIGDSFWGTAKFLNVISKLWTGQTDLYRLEDEIFRTATVIRKLQQGYDMTTASKMAREQFLNYDIRAPWVNAARRSVLPFISYTYRAVPAITDALARRPWKLAKYVFVAEVANAMAYAISGGDEPFERGSLREEVAGDVFFGVFPGGVPRMIRLPANDQFGRPQFLDIRRWIPAGDVFDLHNASPLPIPSWMHFAGPLMIGAEWLLNRSSFTGQDIVDPLADDLGDKTLKWGGFLFQSFAPSAPYIPESWYWNRIAEAGRRTDPVGRTNSRTQAILQSAGIKVSSQDPELGWVYRAREFEATQRALKNQLNKAARDFNRNIIDRVGFQQAQRRYMERMSRLQKLREDTFQPYFRTKGRNPPTEP